MGHLVFILMVLINILFSNYRRYTVPIYCLQKKMEFPSAFVFFLNYLSIEDLGVSGVNGVSTSINYKS